jgi:hypothetical protein
LLDQWVQLNFQTAIEPSVVAAQVYLSARESAGGNQDPTTLQWDAVVLPEPGVAAGILFGATWVGALSNRRFRRGASRSSRFSG